MGVSAGQFVVMGVGWLGGHVTSVGGTGAECWLRGFNLRAAPLETQCAAAPG